MMKTIKNNRPVTTLFMLMSVDGKISTGATDDIYIYHPEGSISQFSLPAHHHH